MSTSKPKRNLLLTSSPMMKTFSCISSGAISTKNKTPKGVFMLKKDLLIKNLITKTKSSQVVTNENKYFDGEYIATNEQLQTNVSPKLDDVLSIRFFNFKGKTPQKSKSKKNKIPKLFSPPKPNHTFENKIISEGVNNYPKSTYSKYLRADLKISDFFNQKKLELPKNMKTDTLSEFGLFSNIIKNRKILNLNKKKIKFNANTDTTTLNEYSPMKSATDTRNHFTYLVTKDTSTQTNIAPKKDLSAAALKSPSPLMVIKNYQRAKSIKNLLQKTIDDKLTSKMNKSKLIEK